MKQFIMVIMLIGGFPGWSETLDLLQPSEAIETVPFPPGSLPSENGGYGVGNGGDFVRARFIKAGFEIIDFLTNHDEGIAFATTYNINVFAFGTVLNTHVVLPTDEKPTDNRGHKVDAIFKNGNLYLYVPTWEKFLSSRGEMYLMVFHEMLRVTGHFDDNYVISRNLKIPLDLELSDKPPQTSKNILCLCSQNGSEYVKLLCVHSLSQETIIEIRYDAKTSFSNTTNTKRQFESCEKQRRSIVKHFGLPGSEEEAEFDDVLTTREAKKAICGWSLCNRVGSYKVEIFLKVKGYEEEFGLACFGRNYHLVSSKGAYWPVAFEICENLKSAILSATSSNPVKLFFKNDVVVDYEFKF